MTDADIQMPTHSWNRTRKPVRAALAFIRRAKGGVTAEDLVAWDRAHGCQLFMWQDAEAAEQYRLEEARRFMRQFRAVFDGMRVRGIIHVREDADANIPISAYQMVETIARHPGMRAQVIADLTRRMRSLASELAMWKLSRREQAALFVQLRAAMDGKKITRAA